MPAAGQAKRLQVKRVQGPKGLAHVAPLWVLIALELLAMAHLRNSFRRHHGG